MNVLQPSLLSTSFRPIQRHPIISGSNKVYHFTPQKIQNQDIFFFATVQDLTHLSVHTAGFDTTLTGSLPPHMATPGAQCIRRLTKDYKMVQQTPPPYVTAHPEGDNILVWHYTIEGPPDSPYCGGFYHGKLLFPADFPYCPPSVMMLTPNGRFKTAQRLCFSMTDFHPKEWNPMWSVASILTGLLSFMLDDLETYGSMSATDQAKQSYAAQSHEHNLNNAQWVDLFPELAEESRRRVASGGLRGKGATNVSLSSLQKQLSDRLTAEGVPRDVGGGGVEGKEEGGEGEGGERAVASAGVEETVSGVQGVAAVSTSGSDFGEIARSIGAALLALIVVCKGVFKHRTRCGFTFGEAASHVVYFTVV